MTEFIEIPDSIELNFTQRWNTYLTLAFAALALVFGLTLKNGTLNATQEFEDLEAGVRAQVPANWLVDSGGPEDEYVFRAQDPGALPFKTVLQVSVLTVGDDATPNIVLDLLNMNRAPRFSTYNEIARADETLRGDPAKRMVYAYTQFERNPFLAAEPLVIKGVDVVVLRRGQAVIITYREERSAFDTNLYRFENLLSTVEIF